jgi:hypothetical protein
MNTTSNFVPLSCLGGPSCSLAPSSGLLLCHSFSVTPLWQIRPRWVHPFLFEGLKNSSHDGIRCSLIKLPHDLLASYNLCLLVVLENQPPVYYWLFDELFKLQSCLKLCRFTQALLQPGLCNTRRYCSIYSTSTVFIQWWLQYKPNSMKMVFSTNGVGSFWVNLKVGIFELLRSVDHWAQSTIFL